MYKAGEMVTFKSNEKIFKAVVTGVNTNGELLADTGEPIALTYGSVEWVIPQPK